MSATAEVTTVLYGERASFVMARDGGTILEAAQAAGIAIPYQCVAGSCASCRARLTRGRVHMLNPFALDDAELAAGFVLACQAIPQSDRLELDFDTE